MMDSWVHPKEPPLAGGTVVGSDPFAGAWSNRVEVSMKHWDGNFKSIRKLKPAEIEKLFKGIDYIQRRNIEQIRSGRDNVCSPVINPAGLKVRVKPTHEIEIGGQARVFFRLDERIVDGNQKPVAYLTIIDPGHKVTKSKR